METKIDETDLQILAILEKNAKVRVHALARKVGIPASTVHHRIKRMEKNGIISGWSTVLDHRKMGFGIKAHVLIHVDVTVLKRLKKTQEDMVNELSKIPNVEKVEIITGEADLLLTARAKDMDEFRKVLLGGIQNVEGITETKTMMVIYGK